MAAIDGTEYRELFQLFATRGEFSQIQQMLGSISAKLDTIVPRDTHDHVWKADQDWKNGARSEMNEISKDLDVIKNLIGDIKEGSITWARSLQNDVEVLKAGDEGWPKQVRDDIENIKAQRVPQWFIIGLGWIVPGLVIYTLTHLPH